MYRVIESFHDLEDYKDTKSGRVYQEYAEGDIYPRDGVNPTPERVELLASYENALGTPLIKSEDEAEPTEEVTEAEPTEEK
jgi:hypothetical protein